MTRRRHTVVAIGESLAVMTSKPAGPLSEPGHCTLSSGGAEGNVCIGLRRLGVQSAWIGRIGQDPLGDLVARKLAGEGVEVWAITDPDASTALMMKENSGTQDAVIHHYRRGSAGSRLQSTDLRADVIGGAAVLHISGVTPALSASAHMATLDAITIARKMRVRVSFDANPHGQLWSSATTRDLYSEIIGLSDIVFAGDREARIVAGDASDPVELADRLVQLGAREAVVRIGITEAVATVEGRQHRHPAVPVSAVDSSGAVDGFIAGYLSEWLVDAPAPRRLMTAAAVAARACAVGGEWEGYPTRAELDRADRSDRSERSDRSP